MYNRSSGSSGGSSRKPWQSAQAPLPAAADLLTAEAVAALPPPGLSGPTSIVFSPNCGRYLAFSSTLRRDALERQLCFVDLHSSQRPFETKSLLRFLTTTNTTMTTTTSTTTTATTTTTNKNTSDTNNSQSRESLLQERLRRERQRFSSGAGITQFTWGWNPRNNTHRLLVPIRGSLYCQDGIPNQTADNYCGLRCVYDKQPHGGVAAMDPQLSPDAQYIAFCGDGELYVAPADPLPNFTSSIKSVTQITFGAGNGVSHGVADFVAQEEMDRYRGYWWHPDSNGILLAQLDESQVTSYRITHPEETDTTASTTSPSTTMTTTPAGTFYEDHRYPFCGQANPSVRLAFVEIDNGKSPHDNWESAVWFDPPREASEYLARVYWLPDGSPLVLWQNRAQTVLVMTKLDLQNQRMTTILTERSDVYINLHHMFKVVPSLAPNAISFLFASERTGYSHLYLYTYVPGRNGDKAMLVRQVTGGDWIVESIVGVDAERNAVYFTGTYDSVLERHLYALPLYEKDETSASAAGSATTSPTSFLESAPSTTTATNNGMRRGLHKVMNAFKSSNRSRATPQDICSDTTCHPIRITTQPGMHNVVMDDHARVFVDTSSDLGRPASVKVYDLPEGPILWNLPKLEPRLRATLYDAMQDDKSMEASSSNSLLAHLPPPELLTVPTSDGSESLHAALYRPDPRVHGPGPYPLVCAVYGGPHVQRVNRSWSQSADMRAQRLRSLGFLVVKCDNRGSARRGLVFESAIRRRLGRLEVLDQVATVRHLTLRGIADPNRVGIYGWSYGGYLSAMCLCRAPDVFHVAVAGAPVTSWDGYDTHYTERYMGLPTENASGYRESAIFDHVPNMKGKLMMVHGLIDENVHFRHTARLINRLIAAGKDYDLLIFPDERHSPRRLRDRIYMEQRISDYFLRHLGTPVQPSRASPMRSMAGHL